MSIPRLRQYNGPALLSYGFRPFFLFGSIFGGSAILFWVIVLEGWADLGTAFSPVDWHIHEMLYGFLPAVVTGFLLTAVPNWTGRLPVQGTGLGLLAALWLAGRGAIAMSGWTGPLLAGAVDLSFLAAVMGVIAIEIVSGRNWRNLKVLLPLALLFAGNAAFHAEVYLTGTSDMSRRIGMAAAILLIMIIGGRIIPSFTRNWLVRENPGRLPAAFGTADKLVLAVSVAALGGWIALPGSTASGVLLVAAGMANFFRQARWTGERTAREPLVLVLHLAYLFIPLGFVLCGAAALAPGLVGPAAGMHAFGAGAVGAMVLAVMMRATLGHTGQALAMSPASRLVFALLVAGVGLRILAALGLAGFGWAIAASGLFWSLAFLGFAAIYGKVLLSRRT